MMQRAVAATPRAAGVAARVLARPSRQGAGYAARCYSQTSFGLRACGAVQQQAWGRPAGISLFSDDTTRMRVTERPYGTSKIEELVKEKKEKRAAEKAEGEASSTSSAAAAAAEGNVGPVENYTLAHPLWEDYDVHGVKFEHREPKGTLDKLAHYTVQMIRFNFDTVSGFKFGKLNENKWLTRVIFLETIAGVPGSIAATLRHLSSLRRLKRDNGWIHTLLEEAENERMHLLTFLTMKQPGPFFRFCIMVSQGIFYNFFFLAYLCSSKFCHRLVGYIEEEAVSTYTKLIDDIDHGSVQHWKTMPAPEVAKNYWKLSEDATVRDVFLVIRADEAHHRDVNHTFGDMKRDDVNPFGLGM